MNVDATRLRLALRDAIAADLPALCEHVVSQMERDVLDGWRCYYTRPLWVRDNTPPPHLNELGQRYLTGFLWSQLHMEPGASQYSQIHPFLEDFWTSKDKHTGYRNLFEPGTLDLEYGGSVVLDDVVNQTANRLLHEENRHVGYEIPYNRHTWYRETVLAKGTLTPAPKCWEHDAAVPLRDPGTPPADDHRYWNAVYQLRTQIIADVIAYRHVQIKPETTLELMQQLASDFPFAPHLSSRSRLVFVQQGPSPLAWAVIIEKVEKAQEYTYPPKLLLIQRDLRKKLQYQHALFTHVDIVGGCWTPLWPREVEINILFHMSRLRSVIDFYTPIVERVYRENEDGLGIASTGEHAQ